jgi:hypothetical protein
MREFVFSSEKATDALSIYVSQRVWNPQKWPLLRRKYRHWKQQL